MRTFVAGALLDSQMRYYAAVVLCTVVVVLSLPVMVVFAMGTEAVTFLQDSPSAKSAEQQGFYMGEGVPGNTYAWGNCTYWVYIQRQLAGRNIPQFWGNANKWDESAGRDGYEINHVPQVGAIFQTDEGQWGHVAYVSSVNPVSGTWTISEMNAPHLNVVSTRTFSAEAAQSYDFIHDRKIPRL